MIVLLTNRKYSNLFWIAIIAILTFGIYFQSLNNQFLSDWDDGIYITNNTELQSSKGNAVKEAFTSFSNGHYHPLTTLSYVAEYNLFGLSAKAFHTTNLLLHIINSCLVFAFVWLLSKQQLTAFVTALLFAVHFMHVESVAWISDRKDLLCTLFFLGALCTYLIHKREIKSRWYVMTFILFLLALFSKAMAVTLPIAFLAVDYFMSGKLSKKMILEKVPFLMVSVIFGYISILSQKSANALADVADINFIDRILFSSYSIVMYVFKLFSFSDLSAFYNYPLSDNGKYPLIFYVAPVLVLIFSVLVYKIKWQQKIIRFGILFFLITIALVLQIVPAGNVIMADRYTYLPYIGLMFIMGYLFNYSLSESKLKFSKWISVIGVILFVLTCSYYSYSRTKVWHDSLTLWNDAIKKSPDAALPYSNRAAIFIKNEQFQNAITDLNKAIAIRPNYVSARFNRGLLLNKTGKYNEAISDFNFVLQNNPRDLVSVYMERGIAHINCKFFREAYEDFTAALKYDPTILMANYYRGLALYSSGMFPEAITELGYLLRRDPENCKAYYVRALSFYEMKKFEEANLDITSAQKLGCQIDPKFANELNSKLKR